ncbi:acyl-CoA dehydrogenase family protein [Galactobacter valiniphilus]|uniref:acyl-CoA dehydrogenase family protein n=1 Tax=Galactobacter valiniphilus TaxID=2676122 RepID=UPI003735E08F
MKFFELSDEHRATIEGARAFATHRLRPLREAIDATADPAARAELLHPVFVEAVEAGLLSSFLPAEVGGTAGDGVSAALAIEELAVESPEFVISMAGPLLALAPLYAAGTPEQISRWVAPFLERTGAPLAALAFSEPAGSANFTMSGPGQGVQTTAVKDGDEWVINGLKAWSSHLPGWDGNGPDLMMIVTRTDKGLTLFAAGREELAGHIEVEEVYDLPGLRGCLTTRVRLNNVRVPDAHRVGEEGQGAELTRGAFQASGASIAAFAAGAMRRALEAALEFTSTQTRGGDRVILAHQSVADVIARAKIRLEATRLVAWRAMDAALSGSASADEWSLIAKIEGSETAVKVITELMQAVGVSSYNNQSPLIGALRDALAYPVIEGSNVGMRLRHYQEILLDPSFDARAAALG